MNRRRRTLLAGACALGLARLARASSDPSSDPSVLRSRGRIRVAVYRDFPPFCQGDGGIDVRIGQALAQALGLRADLMPFDAEDKVEDDLRNMVWRGTLLGYGPADVMLHVPVDPVFSRRNPQVQVFAPYFRDRLQLARDLSRIPQADSLAALQGLPLGVEDGTLASTLLLSAEGGSLRAGAQHFHSTGEALEALKARRVAAVLGLRSELQAAMAGVDGFALSDPVAPGVPPGGWALGLAVKADQEALAAELLGAMNGLIERGEVERIFRDYNVSWVRP
jgi:ABC-type amino acid transport substrate-binding protein